MCRRQIIYYAACGHEEYGGEPIHCSDFEKFLKTLSWNFKARNQKGLKHCPNIVYDRYNNPSPCHVCNTQAFRQQRALAPDARKKGNDQSSTADAGSATNKSQPRGPRSGNTDQQVHPVADVHSTADHRPKSSAQESEVCDKADREAWRQYLLQKEQVVFPLQESPLGRRGAIRRTPSTENLRRIRRDSHPDTPAYLTTPSHPVQQVGTPNSGLTRRGAIRRTSTQESHRRSVRNSQQYSPSSFPNPSSLDSAPARPLKQGRATQGPAADEQWRRYYEALGKAAVAPLPQQDAGPTLHAPSKSESGSRRSGILLTPDRRSSGSKHIKWADKMQNTLVTPAPCKGWAQQLITPPKGPSKTTPMLPEPLRVEKTSAVREEETPPRRQSRFLEDINCVDLGY